MTAEPVVIDAVGAPHQTGNPQADDILGAGFRRTPSTS
jgi:hypothetical protein